MRYTILITLLIWSCNGIAQHPGSEEPESVEPFNEFTRHQNGFIYPDSTINQLKFIVDSFSIKFRNCTVNQSYFSLPHSKAHFISVQGKQSRIVKKLLEKGLPYDSVFKAVKDMIVKEDLVVVKSSYSNYEGKQYINYFSLPSERSRDLSIENYKAPTDGKGRWVFNYEKAGKYTDEGLEGFYFLEDFKQVTIPEQYARMIQYSNCMIDTTATIFNDARYDYQLLRDKSNSKLARLSKLADSLFPYPVYDEYNYEKWQDSVQLCNIRRRVGLDSLFRFDAGFKYLFNDVYNEALKTGYSSDMFEDMVQRFVSPKKALELKRRRKVVGMCSQDERPREHAFNIAVLSATSLSWEIFLRAHLDIMNDRFERMSDGSYAWAGRKTYLRELEALDIDVRSLLLGICFRIDNSSPNHYFGSIGRLGRALAESADKEKIQSAMLEIIADPQLDIYNRTLMYYLFRNYNYYIQDETLQKSNALLLKKTVSESPDKILLEMGMLEEPKEE